jgi:hypothetical protein
MTFKTDGQLSNFDFAAFFHCVIVCDRAIAAVPVLLWYRLGL